MRSPEDIKQMLQRFDDAIGDADADEIDEDTRAAWDVLCWVVDEGRPDALVADYLPLFQLNED